MEYFLCFDQLGEHRWMLRSELRENLTIEFDVALFEVAHQLRVRGAIQASGGVDANLLECAIVTLLQLASDIRIATRLGGGGLCECDLRLTSPHHALCTGKNILSAFDAVCSAFYTWHIVRLGVRHELLNIARIAGRNLEVTALVTRCVPGIAAIEMTLSTLALNHLASLGDADALGYGLGCFLLHSSWVMTCAR